MLDDQHKTRSPWFRARAGWRDAILAMLRVMTGLLFAQHGAQKLFGLLGGFRGQPGATADVLTQHWIAGVLEFFGGLLFAAGLFTSPIAFLLSGLMAVAYFKAHAPDGFWPLLNRGELAALYCFVFLAFWTLGGGRYSADAVVARRRS